MISLCCVVVTAARRRSFRDEYIKWSEEKLSDYDFSKDLERVDLTRRYSSLSPYRRRLQKYGGSSACPNFTEEYLGNATLTAQRSTSPWEFFINFDNNRTPKRIVDVQCLCRGCIDLRTGIEDRSRAASVGVSRPVRVKRFNRTASVDINVGCTCVYPKPVRVGK